MSVRQGLGLLLRIIFRGLIPLLLIVAIIWSAGQVATTFWNQFQQANQVAGRGDAYIGTATAIAPDVSNNNTGNTYPDGGSLVMAQLFSTNTPQADANPPALATNTPVPQATPVPTMVVVDTAITLPTLLPPPALEAGLTLSGTAVPTQVPPIPRNHNLVNIMLLGGDDEVTSGDFIRTDTMLVVSVNLDTQTVSMLSFPRDIFVYIPSGVMQRLNVTYSIGESIGWQPGGGFGLLRQTIFYNFGINVHYFARINFSSFKNIIDTLGGVDIAVDCAYQDYALIDTEIPSGAFLANEEEGLWTLPVGFYQMTGAEALWYVRSRRVTDDFDRGRRQQQLLRAIWRKARENGLLNSFPDLWGQVTEIVDTDIPLDTVLRLLPIALSLDLSSVEQFTLIRTYHTQPWQPPNGNFVQLPNYEPIRFLLEDFYQPPTASQLALAGPSIGVYNVSQQANWDIVAADRLGWGGFQAFALGEHPEAPANTTSLIDLTGDDKGSLVNLVAQALNIPTTNVQVSPDPNRTYDYEIIVADDYNACTHAVLPIEE